MSETPTDWTTLTAADFLDRAVITRKGRTTKWTLVLGDTGDTEDSDGVGQVILSLSVSHDVNRKGFGAYVGWYTEHRNKDLGFTIQKFGIYTSGVGLGIVHSTARYSTKQQSQAEAAAAAALIDVWDNERVVSIIADAFAAVGKASA